MKYIDIQEKFEEGTLNGEDENTRKIYTDKLRQELLQIDSVVLLDDKSYWSNLLFEMEYGL